MINTGSPSCAYIVDKAKDLQKSSNVRGREGPSDLRVNSCLCNDPCLFRLSLIIAFNGKDSHYYRSFKYLFVTFMILRRQYGQINLIVTLTKSHFTLGFAGLNICSVVFWS